MEDRAITTSDVEADEDSSDEPSAGSVSEGLPEETKSVTVAAAGVDPDTPEATDEVAFGAATTSTPAIPAVDVTLEPVAEEPVAEEVAEPEADADPEVAESEADVEREVEEPVAEVAEPEPEPEGLAAEAPAEVVEEPKAAPEVEKQEAEAPDEEAETKEGDDAAEAESAALAGPASPYDLAGDWYVIHSYSGYENKVKVNLETRIHSMHMEGEIFDVVIPMEDVVEIKGGRKVTVPKKVFPGYILVRVYMSDDSWFGVRNTPGVTGFVGSGTKPTHLSRREVERILGVKKPEEGEKAAPRFKPAWDVGETVRVVDGPFADFNGVIEEINLDQSKVRVLVNIFGRDTPVELNFEQIVKL